MVSSRAETNSLSRRADHRDQFFHDRLLSLDGEHALLFGDAFPFAGALVSGIIIINPAGAVCVKP